MDSSLVRLAPDLDEALQGPTQWPLNSGSQPSFDEQFALVNLPQRFCREVWLVQSSLFWAMPLRVLLTLSRNLRRGTVAWPKQLPQA
jgi:hypothetical protein